MVVDFPSVTKIGLQIDSSAYSSTSLGVQLIYSDERKVFSFQKPNKPQKFLELSHIYRKVQHDSYEDIQFSNVDSSKACSDDKISFITGLEFCIEKSNPIVTEHENQATAFWNWRLYADLFDKKINSYDFEIVKFPEDISRALMVRFSTPGSDLEREVLFKRVYDSVKGEVKYDISIPELPNFTLSLTTTKNHQENDFYKQQAILQLDKDVTYEIHYEDEAEREEILNRKVVIFFSSPYNRYEYLGTSKELGGNTNSSYFLSFENFESTGKWLQSILPPPFWENESRAWIALQFNRSHTLEECGINRKEIYSSIKTPQSIIDLIGKYKETIGMEEIDLNLSKKNRTSEIAMSYVNFTYKNILKQIGFTEKEIKVVNLTTSASPFAYKSLSIILNKEKSDDKLFYEVALNTSTFKFKHIENNQVEYLPENKKDDSFPERGVELKFILNVNTVFADSKELTEKYSIENFDSVKNSLLMNQLMIFNASFLYPFYDMKEDLTLDGYLITSYNLSNFRLQNDFVLGSSYNNLQLTSQSVYTSDESTASFDHEAIFTHIGSQKKASNLVKYKSLYSKSSMPDVDFKHEIRSILFDHFTNVTLRQNNNGENLHTLLVFIDTNSSSWDKLNTKLSQIVEQVNPDYTYETCNFTHPSLIINVTADWKGNPNETIHRKKIVFSSPTGNYNKTELHYRTFGETNSCLELHLPYEHLLSYERTLSADGKNFMIRINHSESLDGGSNLDIRGQLVRKDLQSWKINVNFGRMARMGGLFMRGYANIAEKIANMTKNNTHPLNKVFGPSLKSTIYEYYQGLLSEGCKMALCVVNGTGERIYSMKRIFDEPMEVLKNIKVITWETMSHTYNILRKSSITVWFTKYFNLTECNSVYDLLGSLLTPGNQSIDFEFSARKIIHWNSIKQINPDKVSKLEKVSGNLEVYENSHCSSIQLFIPSYPVSSSHESCSITSQSPQDKTFEI